MTPKGRLALAAAEQAGRVLGPRAAHSALRSLAFTLNDQSDRLAALLAAARYAARLGDEAALLSLATVLAELTDAGPARPLRALTELCAQLLVDHRPRVAAELARAEVVRAPGPEAHYLLGRCLHEQAPLEADEAYRTAAAMARTPSVRRTAGADSSEALVRAALHQRRVLALTQRTPAPVVAPSVAAADEGGPQAPSTDARHALSEAAARLGHGGRYARAMAIDQLADLAHHPALERDARRTALRLLARYADERGDELSEVEVERLSVAFAAHDTALSKAFALRRSWTAHAPGATLAPATSPNAAQTIAHLLEREQLSDAVRALRQARLESAHADAAGSLYAAAWLAACAGDPEVAREGALLMEQLLRHGTRPPHGGFLRLARALEREQPGLAAMALERAAARREASATETLGAVLVAEAWRAYGEGHRAAALSALRRADRLTAESVRTTPLETPHAPPAGPGVANHDDRGPNR